jgi:hypothetical protein
VFGALIRLVLVAAVLGGAGVAVLAVSKTPEACTPDVALAKTNDVVTQWQAFVRAGAPDQIRFDEAEATAALQAAMSGADLPVSNVRVHFCADGTAELSFVYPLGPLAIHGLATATVPPSSPLHLDIGRVIIGAVPTALTDAVVGQFREFLDPLTALSLSGPIDRVEIVEGAIVIFHD